MSLWYLILLPLISAGCIFPLRASYAKWIALGCSVLVFVLSILMVVQYEQWGTALTGLTSHVAWFTYLGVTLDLGVDSIALLLVVLTTLLVPLCVWGSFSAITSRSSEERRVGQEWRPRWSPYH